MCNCTIMCRQFALCVAVIMAAAAATEADEAKTKGDQMSYHEATELLSKHTGVVELADGDARVAVCPEYQGRVMTSTCGGPDGPSFGFVNRRFIPVPPERLKVTPEAVLFSADGHFRSKIGVSQRRARNVVGSIDFQAGVLTIVQLTMPDDPSKHNYVNNMWELPQARPYTGDVTNCYNDGPNECGEQYGAFYEIESLSPAVALKTGESLAHRHCTIHIQADPPTLRRLAKEVLGVDLESVRGALPQQ